MRNHSSDNFDCVWAVEIIRKHFADGLESLTSEQFLSERYRNFQRKADPIYSGLINGMDDEALARTFVSYWNIAQTMATQSRFWLERAVAEILFHQVRYKQRELSAIYTQRMLGDGKLDQGIELASLGEDFLEHESGLKAWRVPIKRNALQLIDLRVGEQERERRKQKRDRGERAWEGSIEAQRRDREDLEKVISAVSGLETNGTNLQCNLIVVEPDRLDGRQHAWAFRFANPKSLTSHATRKQERVNLLRLYAYLVQEKILRDPKSLSVAVAELVPRDAGGAHLDAYPDYFSESTYWNSDKFWHFVGVPFAAVTTAIDDVAVEFRDRLKAGLRGLLPEHGKGRQSP